MNENEHRCCGNCSCGNRRSERSGGGGSLMAWLVLAALVLLFLREYLGAR